MFIRGKIISNVSGYRVLNNNIVICNKSNNLYLNNVLLKNDVDYASLTIYNECFFFLSSMEYKTFCLFDNNIIEYSYSLWLNTFSKNTVLGYRYFSKTETYSIFVFDFKTQNVTKQLDSKINLWSLIRFDNQIYFFDYSKVKLLSFSLYNEEYQWESNVSEYGEVRKIIGVYETKLWISLNNKQNTLKHCLVVFDISSGFITNDFEHNHFFSDFGVVLSEEHRSIISIKGALRQPTWLYEYDAKTAILKRALEVPSLKEKQLGVISFSVYGNYIYFTATDGSQIVANTVGVLDYDTLDLLWYEKVTPGNLNGGPPQVTQDKLYVLGAEGTLHIFEKTETKEMFSDSI